MNRGLIVRTVGLVALSATVLIVIIEGYLNGHFKAAVVAAALDLETISKTGDEGAQLILRERPNSYPAPYVVSCSNKTLYIRYDLTSLQRSEFGRKPWWQPLLKPRLLRPGRVVLTDEKEVFWLHELSTGYEEVRLFKDR